MSIWKTNLDFLQPYLEWLFKVEGMVLGVLFVLMPVVIGKVGNEFLSSGTLAALVGVGLVRAWLVGGGKGLANILVGMRGREHEFLLKVGIYVMYPITLIANLMAFSNPNGVKYWPMSPDQFYGLLVVPIVVFDRLYSFLVGSKASAREVATYYVMVVGVWVLDQLRLPLGELLYGVPIVYLYFLEMVRKKVTVR